MTLRGRAVKVKGIQRPDDVGIDFILLAEEMRDAARHKALQGFEPGLRVGLLRDCVMRVQIFVIFSDSRH